MEPMDSQLTALALSDSDSASVEGAAADAADADLQALRRLSDNLAAAFRSPDDFAFLADARIAVPGAPDLRVHRCVLCARSPFLRDAFARRAASAGEEEKDKDSYMCKVELRDLLGDEVEVGYDALRLVLDYLYSGRVAALPKAACLCVDEDACAHVGCRPAVAFMAQVLFAASTFDVAELTNLFQVRLHLPLNSLSLSLAIDSWRLLAFAIMRVDCGFVLAINRRLATALSMSVAQRTQMLLEGGNQRSHPFRILFLRMPLG